MSGLSTHNNIEIVFRPPLKKKLFPVYRSGESKGLTGTFFFIFSKTIYFFFYFPPVHPNLNKLKLGRTIFKNPDLPTGSFFPTQPTGNDFLLKGGLSKTKSSHCQKLHSTLLPSLPYGDKKTLCLFFRKARQKIL